MMNCKKFKINLSAYLDNELLTKEKELLQQHLNHCEYCCQELKFLTMMQAEIDKISGLSGEKKSSEMWMNIREKIKSRASPTFQSWRKVASIAALLALTIITFFYDGKENTSRIAVKDQVVNLRILTLEEEFAGQMLGSLIISNGTVAHSKEIMENIYVKKISEQLL